MYLFLITYYVVYEKFILQYCFFKYSCTSFFTSDDRHSLLLHQISHYLLSQISFPSNTCFGGLVLFIFLRRLSHFYHLCYVRIFSVCLMFSFLMSSVLIQPFTCLNNLIFGARLFDFRFGLKFQHSLPQRTGVTIVFCFHILQVHSYSNTKQQQLVKLRNASFNL